jgi:hypothetical protein
MTCIHVLSNIKLKTKLQISFIVIGFLSIVATGWLAFKNARSAIETITFDRLTSIRDTKKRQIESYFQDIHNQAVTLSGDRMVIEAVTQFIDAFQNPVSYNLPIGNLPPGTYTVKVRGIHPIDVNNDVEKTLQLTIPQPPTAPQILIQ